SHDSIIPFNVRYISPSEYDTEGKRWSLGVNAAENDWIWIIPSGIKPQAGTLDRMITGVNSETDAVLLVEEESDKAKLFSELYGEPISHQYRVLLKKESLDKHGFSNRMQAEPLWLFVLKNQETLNWNEVVENNNASFEGLQENSLSFMDDQIFDAFEIKRELKLTDPRIKEKLHDFASKSRRLLHEKHRRVGIPLVSIVIPHFNLPEMLERCIDSIVTNTDEIPFEIIVVDNGSNNTTDELIKKLHKSGVYIIRNSTNEGFAKACNKGSKEAKGKYVLFLNNDTEVQKGWLSAMMRAMQEGEEVGIVGAKLLFPDGKIQHVGVVFDDDCIPSHLYQNGPSNLPQIQNRRYYQVVTAACTLIRKNLFRQLGGFDEGFRNSFEDVDFCLRARRMSVRALYEPEAVVIHHTEQTPGRKDHDSENINRYLERWGGKVQPDLKLYANIDGYDIVEKDGRKKLVPFNDGQSEKTVEKSSPPPDQTTDVKENINTAPTLSAQPVDVSVKNEDTLESLLAKADLMIKDGRFNNAEEELVNGSRRVNGNIRQRALYWTLLGDARFRLNRPDEAFTCYKKAVSDDPSAERAWIGIGTYHLINDELDTAEEIFGKILTLSPEYDRGFMGMGNVMLKRKEFDKALKNFQEASRLTPDHRPAIVGLVASAVQAGKMMEAQPGVERYLQIHPEDVEARFHLAAIFYGCSHIEKARIHAEHVLETHPNHRGAKELMNHIEES
ncbi:MAG: glycosyltransferase, partial [Candidatus Electryonea clarkiae]|nr:glycosyltransferase [Candidatus Electryonea clarkiae]